VTRLWDETRIEAMREHCGNGLEARDTDMLDALDEIERLLDRHGEMRSRITDLLCQHCECRPVRLDRATYGHSHDCDDDTYEALAKILREDGAPIVDPEWAEEAP
jgi:hypothetical protein